MRFIERARCWLDRRALGILQSVFHFDTWHAAAPYSCRPYKKAVVGLIDSVHPRRVVEVGCGLGDIVSRVTAPERYGIDTDARVIRAARFLHPRGVRWIHGDCTAVGRDISLSQDIDCLVMVNWIHNLSPEELAKLVGPLLPKLRYLVLDAIDPQGPASYRFKHDFGFLADRTRRISTVRAVNEPRSFLLLQVIR